MCLSDLWANIVNGLMARPHRRVCLVGGPADTDSLRNLHGLLIHLKPTLLTDMDLLSVGVILQHAKLFIGHRFRTFAFGYPFRCSFRVAVGPTDSRHVGSKGRHVTIMRNSCHCVGKEFMNQCRDRPCYPFL